MDDKEEKNAKVTKEKWNEREKERTQLINSAISPLSLSLSLPASHSHEKKVKREKTLKHTHTHTVATTFLVLSICLAHALPHS